MLPRITRWLRRLLNRRKTALIAVPKGESHVEAFFTDAETEMSAFGDLLEVESSKRLLVLHGIGGVGKSTLLIMFRRICRERGILQGSVSGESASTPIDILEAFASDLKHPELQLRRFQEALDEYRRVQAKVHAERSKLGAAADIAKGAVRTVPVVGPVAASAAAPFIDWLRNFLEQPQIDMFLKPMVILNSAFVADIGELPSDRKVILMIDTYERLLGLDAWLCEFTQQLTSKVAVVVAGREFPFDFWNRA